MESKKDAISFHCDPYFFLDGFTRQPSQSKQYGGGTSRAAGSAGCGTARLRLPSRRVTPSSARLSDLRVPCDGCLYGPARSTAGPGQAERGRVHSREESRPRSPLTSRPGGH